jgi:hypothetical protein
VTPKSFALEVPMDVSFEEFKASWLEPVVAGNPTTVQLGRRFAHKIVSQWLDIDEDSLDVTYCDGSGDGGIDIAGSKSSRSCKCR